MTRFGAVLAGLGLLGPAGCGDQVAGGRTANPGYQPPGKVLVTYRVTSCVDRAKGPMPDPRSYVRLVQHGEADPLLVEQRQGYRSVLVEHSLAQEGYRIYQTVFDGVLLDYRVPLKASAEGYVALATEWTARGEGKPRQPGYPLEVCRLAPVDGSGEAATPSGQADPGAAHSDVDNGENRRKSVAP